MLSPYKLWKADQKTIRRPVTFGPQGTPGLKGSGTPCFRHPNVDWTVHRLTPAVYGRTKPGSKARGAMQKVLPKLAPKDDKTAKYLLHTRPKSFLQNSSPRWGQGNAPGLHGRKTVPIPSKGSVEVSKKTYAAVGAGAVAYGGYKAYQHKDQIKEKAHQVGNNVHSAFHSTRHLLGAHS